MEELRAKRDKIKVEKERFLMLQELDEMEATMQREMLEEQRKRRRAAELINKASAQTP